MGIATLASFAIDVFVDYQKYGNNTTNFYKAVAIDTGCMLLGVAAGAMLTTVASPVGFAIGTVFVGTMISSLGESLKQDWIGS